MGNVITIGVYLAKNVFQVHGVDASGEVVFRRQLRRGQVVGFFRKQPACLVGMEACATAHHWAREIGALGHEVRLMPPRYVKPFQAGRPLSALVARRWRHGGDPPGQAARYCGPVARRPHCQQTDQGRRRRAGQQDRAGRLGVAARWRNLSKGNGRCRGLSARTNWRRTEAVKEIGRVNVR